VILDKQDLEASDRKWRLNLINSISGIKPANLIGTKSKDNKSNLGIFSSVVHLGSSPAQLGFVMRPQTEKLSDTYKNIQETTYYTINHIEHSFIKNAHYTSAKLSKGQSEFDAMNLQEEFNNNFFAPFVKRSLVKIGMKLVEEILLPNQCIFIVGSIELIILPNHSINDLGQLDLDKLKGIGISGLNSYYKLKKIGSFPYVRENELPEFK
jgi:flavin reductase (DIM6/NTAB) family NADH-FMN oxidoreductase RutF